MCIYVFSTTSFVLLNFAVVAWTLQKQLKATAYSWRLSQWRWRQLCGRAELGGVSLTTKRAKFISLIFIKHITSDTYPYTYMRAYTYISIYIHSCSLRQWTASRRRDHKGRNKEDQGEAFVRVRKRQRRSNVKAKRKADRQTTKKRKKKEPRFRFSSAFANGTGESWLLP